jgi:hypothetical protein
MTLGSQVFTNAARYGAAGCISLLLAIILLPGVIIWGGVAPTPQRQAGWCDGAFDGQEFGQEL